MLTALGGLKANPPRKSEEDTRIGANEYIDDPQDDTASEINNDGTKRTQTNNQISDINGLRTSSTRTAQYPNEDMIFTKYTIYWVHKDSQKVHDLVVELPHVALVQEAIGELINLFNSKFAIEGLPYTFNEDTSQFQLFAAKKSGHPKLDYPAYDGLQVVNETGVSSFTVVEIDPKAIKTSTKKHMADSPLKASKQAQEERNNASGSKSKPSSSNYIEQQPPIPQQQQTKQIIIPITPAFQQNNNSQMTQMTDPDMNVGHDRTKSMGHISVSQEPQYEIVTYCICLKKRVLKPISYGITLQPETNRQQLNNPLLR
jgi:hypothetical protein